MKDFLDEYGSLILSAIAIIAVLGLVSALFFGKGNEIITQYLNNSI